MQTNIEVICSRGRSLREAITRDRLLSGYGFEVLKEKQPHRKPGWAKIAGTKEGRRGTINIDWNSATRTLTCRVVNRGAAKPSLIVGDFMHYLLDRYQRRLKLVLVHWK